MSQVNNQRGVAQIFILLLLLVGIFGGVYLVQQTQIFKPKAYNPTAGDVNSIIAEEKKVAEINEEGKFSKERAEFLAYVDPETFQEFVQQDLIENPDEIKKPERLTREDLNSIAAVARTTLTGTSISSCGEITSSGDYSLAQDVSSDGGVCIYIHDTQNVNLDCQNHSIVANYNPATAGRALIIDRVQNFSVKNCSPLHSIRTDYPRYPLEALEVWDSSSGVFENNIINDGGILISGSNNLQFLNNTINSDLYQAGSSHVQIRNNHFRIVGGLYSAGVIGIRGGDNNIIENNTIDGGWDGDSANEIAADDGIIISGGAAGSQGIIISGNIIRNNFDCGIETAGFISNTKMINNQIYNSGLCGIGGWIGHSWLNNIVDSNVVDGSAYMFYFFLQGIPKQPYIYFKDNTFSNNTFLNQRSSSYIGATKQYSSLIDFQNLDPGIPSSSLQLGNNVFKNNDFGEKIPAPVLMPATMVIDQGGNKCMPLNDTLPRPLICSNAIPTSGKPSPCPPDGDVNDDKIITNADAELVLQIVAGSLVPTTQQRNRVDVDGDGRVTSADALVILRYIKGKVSTFPACK